MPNFKKLGLDRVTMNISKAFESGIGTGGLITGDITRGEVVTVDLESGAGSATVKDRRVGALPLAVNLVATNESFNWSISGTTLSVSDANSANGGSITFWVF
jgi:adenylosuccinate synthase